MSEYKSLNRIEMPKRSIVKTAENKYWSRYKESFSKQFSSEISFITGNNEKGLLMIGHEFNIEFFNTKSERIVYRFDKVNKKATCSSFKYNGDISAVGYINGFVKLFNLQNKKTLRNWNCSNNIPIGCLDFDKFSTLYTCDDNLNLNIYDFSIDKRVNKIENYHNDLIRQIKIENDLVYTSSYDKTVKIFDTKTNETVNNFIHNDSVECFLLKDNILITGSNCNLVYWDLRNSEKPLLEINNNTKMISSLCFNDNFSRVFVGSYNEIIHIYDKNTSGEIMHHMKMKSGVSSLNMYQGKLGIGLVNGNFILKKRDMNDIENEEKLNGKYISEEEKKMYEFLSEGIKKQKKDPKFYNRGIYSKPINEDLNIIINKPKKYKISKWDKLIRKFKFSEALESALELFNSQIIITVIEELENREVLETSIKNLNEESIKILLDFILKKLDSYNYQKIVLYLFELSCKFHLNSILNDNSEIFVKINEKLELEAKNLQKIKKFIYKN